MLNSAPFPVLFLLNLPSNRSRNHASQCGVAGVGPSNPVTTLVMDPERCGIEFGAAAAGERDDDGRRGQPAREVDVYVQHDSFVQQGGGYSIETIHLDLCL